jgi:short-subunit dehydrogenase
MPKDLRNLPIVITGASSGIGAATALACARKGMPVAIAARRVDKLEAVAAEIKREGGKVITVACDVTKPDECEALVDATVREFGSIYGVFANAGYGVEQSFLSQSDDDIRAMFETNFWGSVNVIRPALKHMTKARKGHVLWCSSCLAKIGIPMYASYCASKAMQDHFARAMRHELLAQGIFVSSVHPVGTKTEFFEKVEARGAKLLSKTPERFMQPPSRVANAVVSCLRSPRGEVWTSLPMRLGLGMAGMFPGMADFALGKMYAHRMKRDAQ